IKRCIAYTSRAPRLGETDGIDYHFISACQFESKIKEGAFLEWSGTYGAYYGTPRSVMHEVEKGDSRILIIDRAGARQVAKQVAEAVLIWINVPSLKDLESRLRFRGTENEQQIGRRLYLAQQELDHEAQERLYKHHIINDIFEKSLKDFEEILKKELNF